MSHKLPLTRRCLFSLPLALGAQPAAPVSPAVATAAALKDLALDAGQCWRVRDLTLVREDVKLYLADGFVVLSRPLGDGPVGALFWAEVEGGDGEIIVLPPSAGERGSLARWTQSPNLNDHFRSAVLLFTDGTAEEIARFVREHESKPAPEMGALLADQFSQTLRNLTSSFEARIVQDVAGKVLPENGIFFAALGGSRHGNFDVVYDPQSIDQVVVAQLQFKENRSYYNIWTSFQSRRVRKDPALAAGLREFLVEDVKIDAALGTDLRLTATTTLRIRIPEAGAVRRIRNSLAFDISRRVRIREVSVDGEPAQVLQRENLRSTLLRGSENEVFLVAMDRDLPPGAHTVTFRQEGEVITPAGNDVYFVGARGTWYPHHGLQFATYEMKFRCPRHLSLVATGELVEERVEGETRITRRRSTMPLRIAGFNLGEYKRSTVTRGELTVDVFANKRVEASLTPQRREVALPAPMLGGPRGPRQGNLPPVPVPIQPAAPDPAAQIGALAAEVAEAFEFLSARIGPPPLKTLAVSPIPGAFGQGFPGLIYLSTLAYLPVKDRPQFANSSVNQVFFSDILVAHEVAHQWWGNTVSSAGYRDEWIMEALANYSALLLLERKKGTRALESVLDRYRDELLEKGTNGQSPESAGPIALGARLETSETPGAYRIVVYEKGTWIIHMLRRRLGDTGFFAMLRELHGKFLRARMTTDDLRAMAARHQPKPNPDGALEQFFSSYVESTGIPALKLTAKIKRTAVSVELEQAGVNEDFAVDVPVEVDYGGGRTEIRWIRTEGAKTSVEWVLKAPAVKVLLDPRNTLLAVKR